MDNVHPDQRLAAVLAPSERLLWSGQPVPQYQAPTRTGGPWALALTVLVASLVLSVVLSLLFHSFCLVTLLVLPVLPFLRRSSAQRYALTNRRALIGGGGLFGQQVQSFAPSSARAPTATRTVAPVATAKPSAAVTATRTPTPTATPAPPTATPTTTPIPPTATPDPVAGLTIPDLRKQSYGAGEITPGAVYLTGPGSTTYRIRYPAGDLELTGLLHVPDGPGPFPVVIANRGYIAPERYQPGMDSRTIADVLVRNGYLVVAPDYRGYAGGDNGPNPFYTGYYQDVLHLVLQAQRLPMARSGAVGMWGHSRGASITVAVNTIIPEQIAAAVVYAPAPADLAADYARRFRNSSGNPGTDTWPFPPEENPTAYARVSPITYLDAVQAPMLLHHGTADTVVDASASIALADALEAAGKDVTLHLYEGGPHTLVGADEQQYIARTLAFFATHLRGQP